MGSLIDTSIFIEAERGRLDLDSHIEERIDDEFFMSVITASELLHGVYRATATYRSTRLVTIERWIERFALAEIDLSTAREHARIHAQLRSAGNMIGPHDLWLAATCLTLSLKMVTANAREFAHVPNLVVDNWSTL